MPTDPRPEDVTWEDLRQHAEASWRLTGPDSGGGRTLYRYQGRLFVVGYGDHSSLPGGAETRPGSTQRDDILSKLGPTVLDEAMRCAVRRLRP